MKSKILSFIFGLQCAVGLFTPKRSTACNVGEGTHDVALNKTTDAAFAIRHLLCKKGTSADHIDLCGAADMPYGTVPDEPASGDLAAVKLLGKGPSTIMIGSAAITQGVEVFTDAAGKVQAEPAVAGTYWLVGRALTACAADGKQLEVQDCEPIRVIVLALLGNTNGEITAVTYTAQTAATVGADIAAFTDPPSAGEMAALRTFVNALKADLATMRTNLGTNKTEWETMRTKAEELADDVRAVARLGGAPALLKVLAA